MRHMLSVGDLVTIYFPLEQPSEHIQPSSKSLDIVYEDAEIIVLNKPEGLATIPSYLHQEDSVASRLVHYFQKKNIASTVHIVNRLDRDTSGLMCVAKHSYIHYILSERQKKHEIHREYEAIVEGHVEQDQAEIIAPIARKEASMVERTVSEHGQYAHTAYTVLKRFTKEGQPMTHVRLKLYTGRTHQIRVHMASIGHPLVGDELYGGSTVFLSRQALHCVYVSLAHPITNEPIIFEAVLPAEIAQLKGE